MAGVQHQHGWNLCNNCLVLFFDESEIKGVCAYPQGTTPTIGRNHSSFYPNGSDVHKEYILDYDFPTEQQHIQINWKSCGKCYGLFYDGFPEKGICPAGGNHDSNVFGVASLNYALAHDSFQYTGIRKWRFCSKCYLLFYNGFPGPGKCPAGGGHDGTTSFDYVLAYEGMYIGPH